MEGGGVAPLKSSAFSRQTFSAPRPRCGSLSDSSNRAFMSCFSEPLTVILCPSVNAIVIAFALLPLPIPTLCTSEYE